ncbi:hypothetical protein BH09PAT2_BH09PAT2_07940 [soil metagenome]
MKLFKYHCYTIATTIEEVKNQMTSLDYELEGTDMKNLIAFNHTYLIITRNVYDKLNTEYFADDELMKKTDVCFGNYYFDALHQYINTNDCPPAWRILFDACRRNDTYQFVYMAMGVNAHVNNDLPQTLHDVMKGNICKEDYEYINDIIGYSISEVVDALDEKNVFLHLSEHLGTLFYTQFLKYIICKWRSRAWNQYIDLNNGLIFVDAVEKEAQKKAIILAKIQKIYQIPSIMKIC